MSSSIRSSSCFRTTYKPESHRLNEKTPMETTVERIIGKKRVSSARNSDPLTDRVAYTERNSKRHKTSDEKAERVFQSRRRNSSRFCSSRYDRRTAPAHDSRSHRRYQSTKRDSVPFRESHSKEENLLVSLNKQISQCRREKRYKKAFELYEELKNKRLVPNDYTFAPLLSICKELGDLTKAMSLYKDAKLQGVQLDIIKYNTLLATCLKARDLKTALSIYDEMPVKDIYTYNTLILICAYCHNFELAIDFFNKISAPDSYSYHNLMKAYSEVEDCDGVFDLFEKMKQNRRVRVNDRTFSIIVMSCGKTNNIKKALKVLDWYKYNRIPLNSEAYSCLITACSKARDKSTAFKIYELMKADPHVKTSRAAYCSLITICGITGCIDEAFEMAKKAERDSCIKMDIQIYRSLVTACGHAFRTDKIPEVLEMMCKKGIRPNIIFYNCMFTAYGKGKNENKLSEIYDKIKRDGLQLNSDTYVSLILAFGECKNTKRGFEVLNDVRSDRELKNKITIYNALITVCGKLGKMDKAERVMQMMQQDGIQPEIVTYRNMISAAGNASDLKVAERMWRQMRENPRITLDIDAYSVMIKTYGTCGDLENGFKLIKEIQFRKLKPNFQVLLNLMTACGRLGKIEKAVELFRIMRDMKVRGNIMYYDALITALGTRKDYKGALRVLSWAEQDNEVEPNVITYFAAMKACCNANLYERVFHLFKMMKEAKITPDEKIYSLLFTACIRTGDIERLSETIGSMQRDGIELNIIFYNSMLCDCLDINNLELALFIYRMIERNPSFQPNENTFTSLMALIAKVGDIKTALKIRSEMLARGITPNVKIQSSFIILYGNLGRLDEALDVVEKMKDEADIVIYNSLLKACESSKNFSKPHEVLRMMKERGIEPDTTTHSVMINLLLLEGKFEAAKTYFLNNLTMNYNDDRVDCHKVNYGEAFIRAALFAARRANQQPFEIIVGKGLGRSKLFMMRDYILTAAPKYLSGWRVYERDRDSGVLIATPS